MGFLHDLIWSRRVTGGGGGDSDFSTAKCTIDIDVTPDGPKGSIIGVFCADYDDESFAYADIPIDQYLTSQTVNIILYKGKSNIALITEGYLGTITGNYDVEDGIATGDVTVTIRKQ